MIRKTNNLEEFKAFAGEIVSAFKSSDKALVLGLSGNLGSGKTTFTQEVAKKLGILETVTSPTFVIEKIYKLPQKNKFEHLIHVDAYRLENERELHQLGWQELTLNPKNIILIEWPERVERLIPKDALRIQFTFIDENTREIEVKANV